MKLFEGQTADAAWLQAARELSSDASALQQSRAGLTRELAHVAFEIQDPRQRWIISRQPPINPAFAIAEVVWILAGRNDSAFLNFWNPALPKFAGTGQTYYGAYGYRLRQQLEIDQIDRVYQALLHNPDTRQAVLQIWDGRTDLPIDQGKPASADIPCNICSFLKIREGRLEWMQVMRSNDLILGLPHNVVQFTSLQEIIAGWLGLDLGTYHHFSDSLHVYERNFADLEHAPAVDAPANSDRLDIPREQFDPVFSEVERRFDELRAGDLDEARFDELLRLDEMPGGYANFVRIAAADSARRRGWAERTRTAAEACTNPALRLAWARWMQRQRDRAEGGASAASKAGG